MGAKSKQKYYVVWKGLTPGIYDTWAACEAQVKGQVGAKYKSFATRAEAQLAFAASPSDYIGKKSTASKLNAVQNPPSWRSDTVLPLPLDVQAHAVAVDAACAGNPGQMEYRGVDLRTGQVLFHVGPLLGTNNIGEFLAIVHALALQAQQGKTDTIYSDSRTAQSWVKQRQCKTTLARKANTEKALQLVDRAVQWLQTHSYSNPILKWDTEKWGEIPADFGRK